MLHIKKFYERKFVAKESKDAYLKACKFVASNVISKASKVEATKVTWDILPVETSGDDDLPTFMLTLYIKFDDAEFSKMTCDKCKEFHQSFFINENFNCNRCNKVGYERNLDQKLDIAVDWFRRVLDDELNKM